MYSLSGLGRLVCFPKHEPLGMSKSEKGLCYAQPLRGDSPVSVFLSVHIWATGYLRGHLIMSRRWKWIA